VGAPSPASSPAARAAPEALIFALLRLLADGEFHSGEVLAQRLGMSRASVNNALRAAEEYGLTLHSVRGRGYRLVSPVQWLDTGRIAGHLGAARGHFRIEILDSAPSSNTLVLQRAAQGAPSGSVLAVEWQSGGRGRMGRAWHSGLGNALTFSLLWRFDLGLASLSGLSLAVGVAMVRALRALGVEDARLKWPNDVLGPRGKLAGILIEAQGDMLGPSAVVIGIGINLALPGTVSRHIGQPATSLAGMVAAVPERNLLLAVLLRELHGVLNGFARQGFAGFRAEWESCHAAHGQEVRVQMPDGAWMAGVVRGVAGDGSLMLDTAQGMRIINAGEVSLRNSAQDAAG
jgi:BirA family biotin operon repressor/biotin-[acetyl-CoA-carboxylase] ligase